MIERTESVHVHRGDVAHVIAEYRAKGFKLKEKTSPTIIAQRGFIKLVFVADEDAVLPPQGDSNSSSGPTVL